MMQEKGRDRPTTPEMLEPLNHLRLLQAAFGAFDAEKFHTLSGPGIELQRQVENERFGAIGELKSKFGNDDSSHVALATIGIPVGGGEIADYARGCLKDINLKLYEEILIISTFDPREAERLEALERLYNESPELAKKAISYHWKSTEDSSFRNSILEFLADDNQSFADRLKEAEDLETLSGEAVTNATKVASLLYEPFNDSKRPELEQLKVRGDLSVVLFAVSYMAFEGDLQTRVLGLTSLKELQGPEATLYRAVLESLRRIPIPDGRAAARLVGVQHT